jgi:hypothetical protein
MSGERADVHRCLRSKSDVHFCERSAMRVTASTRVAQLARHRRPHPQGGTSTPNPHRLVDCRFERPPHSPVRHTRRAYGRLASGDAPCSRPCVRVRSFPSAYTISVRCSYSTNTNSSMPLGRRNAIRRRFNDTPSPYGFRELNGNCRDPCTEVGNALRAVECKTRV